jgi:ribA/ribD-fused uncharacterized protein
MNLENLNLNDDGPKGPDVIWEFQGEYRFLSNFWECKIELCGITFNSSEAAYVAAKTDDPELWRQIARMSPAEAKKFGHTLPLDTKVWDLKKVPIMREIVYQKFAQNPDLAEKLLATGHARLVEGNKWGDKTWGMCPPGPLGFGLNCLGLILEFVRTELRTQ